MIHDILIIGAGIVGAACATELAAAGMNVAVVERDCVGSGATAAGMGHIVVMDESPAQIALTRYGQQLWDALYNDAPDQHELLRCGTLWVAADTDEMQEVTAKHDFYTQHDIPSIILNEHELYEAEPHLRAGLAGGLLVPNDGVVYPPRSALSLIAQAQQHGAKLYDGTVIKIEHGGVILADHTLIHADAIVVANGSTCIELLDDLPIRAKKGHLVITDRYPEFVRHQLVELGYIKNAHASEGDSVAFNVQPRPTGQILIGSSRQFDRADRTTDFAMLHQMLQRAIEYMPEIANLNCIRVWTGIRAASPDGLPLIGQHHDTVWVNVGHEGLGITTSLASAKILAAQMLNRECAIDVGAYVPRRTKSIEHRT